MMPNGLLTSLERFCRQHLLEEKILIVPAYGSGHELAETLVRNGGRWVNLRPQTVARLAQSVVGTSLYRDGITLLTGHMMFAAVEDIFLHLEAQKAMQYFARAGASPGLVRVLTSAILDLRNAGLTSDRLSPAGFVSPDKGEDLKTILAAYELYLEKHKYLDTPGLVWQARKSFAESLRQQSETIYLLPSFVRLAPVEGQFIEELAGGRLHLLEPGPVHGLALSGTQKMAVLSDQGTRVETDVQLLPYALRLGPCSRAAG